MLLALVLPFEAPLFRLGPLQITTVELLLYATLAAWGIAIVLPRLIGRGWPLPAELAWSTDPVVRAVALWFVVSLASAASAPFYRAAALKFTLRSLSGILLFFAARDLARTSATTRRVFLALTAGALLSAGSALLELVVPSTASLWRFFREGTFDALGLPRPSGVFGYPTIGAMYWEAAIPLLVVTPFLRGGQSAQRVRPAAVGVLGCAVLIAAVLASATRSAVVGSAIGCAALYLLGRGLGRSPRLAAAGSFVVVVGSWALVTGLSGFHVGRHAGSLRGDRLTSWREEDLLLAECSVGALPSAVHVGQSFSVGVILRNTGTLDWARSGPRGVLLSYHWRRLDGATTASEFEGIRTPLPSDMAAGSTGEVVARVRTPMQPGTYRLQWDLVEEGITWFSQRGKAMAEQDVLVKPVLAGAPAPVVDDWRPAPILDPPPPSRAALWRAAIVLWRKHPLLGIGPDNFRRSWQSVLSPSPTGQRYTDTRVHANSLYFETLADLGLAGIAALATIAIALARLVLGHAAADRVAGLGCGLGAAVFFVHGLLDYFLEFTPLFGLFWLLLGLTAACRTHGGLRSSPE